MKGRRGILTTTCSGARNHPARADYEKFTGVADDNILSFTGSTSMCIGATTETRCGNVIFLEQTFCI